MLVTLELGLEGRGLRFQERASVERKQCKGPGVQMNLVWDKQSRLEEREKSCC